VRRTSELAYRKLLAHDIVDDILIGELAQKRLIYLPTVTREAFERTGRITHHINDGRLFADIGLRRARFDPSEDRVMVCGSLDMIDEVSAALTEHGLTIGANAAPGEFVIERAFVG
jgi:ferredoxin--NADP+ reductase